MKPLNLSASGVWALLIRVQAALFVPVVLAIGGAAVHQVRRIDGHDLHIQKLDQRLFSYTGYPPDVKDLETRFVNEADKRFRATTDAQLLNLSTRIEAMNVTLAEIKVRQSMQKP